MKKNLLKNDGNWYKGNLHMHSTISDGRLTPDEAKEIYYQKGYDFIALTDHRKAGKEELYKKMLVLPGAEWDAGNNIDMDKPVYHIVSIGSSGEEKFFYDNAKGIYPKPQEIIDEINRCGGAAIIAHPHWSLMNPEEIVSLHGYAGAEIYNTMSGIPWNPRRADSSLYFDLWADRGIMVNALAADDTHGYAGDETRSYIMLNAGELSTKSVVEGIKNGNLYASQGPEFRSIILDDEKRTIRVECSEDVKTVVFISNMSWDNNRVQQISGGEATYQIDGGDRYIRIELIDEMGKIAWSSPYKV